VRSPGDAHGELLLRDGDEFRHDALPGFSLHPDAVFKSALNIASG
jgi:hypothetical protein